MKITTTFLATAIALASFAKADVFMLGCNISHDSKGLNTHTINFGGVPPAVSRDICNQWEAAVKLRASRDHSPKMEVDNFRCISVGNRESGVMQYTVRINKQRCVQQTEVIQLALEDALEGRVSFTDNNNCLYTSC
jgi:hypothetical protein